MSDFLGFPANMDREFFSAMYAIRLAVQDSFTNAGGTDIGGGCGFGGFDCDGVHNHIYYNVEITEIDKERYYQGEDWVVVLAEEAKRSIVVKAIQDHIKERGWNLLFCDIEDGSQVIILEKGGHHCHVGITESDGTVQEQMLGVRHA